MREAGGAVDGAVETDAFADVSDAVKSLRPPLVTRDAESGNRRGRVDELGDLLVQCETGDEVMDSLVDGEGGFAEKEGLG